MNNQELYNTVANHLLTQGRKSEKQFRPEYTNVYSCAYRGDDNTKCAIGCLIPDDKFESKFEGVSIDVTLYDEQHGYFTKSNKLSSIVVNIINAAGLADENLNLAIQLQRIHDKALPEHWKKELQKIAIVNSLIPIE